MAARRKVIRASFETGADIGIETVPDDVFRAFIETKVQEHPPVPLIFPDGRTEVASPWIIALNFVDGGKPILDRFVRIVSA